MKPCRYILVYFGLNDRLGFRIMQADQQARADLLNLVEAGDVPIETPSVDVSALQTTGSTTDIFYYHTNHLGSTAYVTDQNQNITQGFLYAPFGEITTEFDANFGSDIIPKYSFNAKELDEETGMYYYEARYYKPPVFTSRDPHFERYPTFSPYTYCFNNPLKYIDPTGKDGVLIIFPNYMVNTETRLGKQPLGHAGVLLINNKTGLTKYYEYGRYPTTDGTKGKVRKVTVPNVVIDKETGKPTQESLNNVLSVISKRSGQGGKIQGVYVEGDFKIMNDYAQTKYKESNIGNQEYNKDRKSYSLLTNNCGTFAVDVLKQDSDAKKNAPWILNPTPINIGEEFQKYFPKIYYDPKTNTTTGDIYN